MQWVDKVLLWSLFGVLLLGGGISSARANEFTIQAEGVSWDGIDGTRATYLTPFILTSGDLWELRSETGTVEMFYQRIVKRVDGVTTVRPQILSVVTSARGFLKFGSTEEEKIEIESPFLAYIAKTDSFRSAGEGIRILFDGKTQVSVAEECILTLSRAGELTLSGEWERVDP